jgi:hypothetical protein
LLLKLNLISALLNISFVYLSAQISLEAIAISQIIKNLIILPISYYFLSQVIYISLKDLADSLINQFCICIFMLVVMLGISNVELINNLDPYLLLIVRILVFSLALFAGFSIFAPGISRLIKAKIYQIYK